MKELSVGEQRYKAVMAVLSDGRTVMEVASELVKTEVRATKGVVRKKNAEGQAPRR